MHVIEQKKGLSQETLKLIACVTMLIDHIGYLFVPGYGMRLIGRIAFPIYCFLLAEGAHYTRSPQKYGLRLLIGAVIAEIPFDLTFFGRLTWDHQNVMVTLLIGFVMLQCMEHVSGFWKYILLVPFYLLANLLNTDYGGMGVALIALFAWSRGMQGEGIVQLIGMAILFRNSFMVTMGGVRFPLGMFAILALIPIHFYSGKKRTSGKPLQWAFYLFYPAHMTVLLLLKVF